MKKKLKGQMKDSQLDEFERKDLGEDIRKSKSGAMIYPHGRQMPTSILLDPVVIDRLREKASKRGIGYQTMLKIIVHEHLDEY